jgi:hypothetical protein
MLSSKFSFPRVHRSVFSVVTVSVLLSIVAIAGFAQVDYSTATLRGTVTDPQGAVVPDAGVTATNQSTGVHKTAQTAADGHYQISALPPGTYDISVSKQGFRKEIAKGVQLSVGQVLLYDTHLKIGEASESVEVSADSVPLIQVEQSQQANTINQLQVEELPNINRTFTYNVYTVPGVTNSEAPRAQNPGFTGYLTTGFSIGRSNGRNNLSTIDGGENEYGTGQYRVTNLPVEAIQEYQVNRNAFAAEFGFTDGSAINIVTKTGGNLWHGSAYGYFRDQHTEATNFFNGLEGFPKAFNQSLYMGGSIGGAIKKDKLFFFAAYERERLDTPFFNFIVNTPQAQGISFPGLGQNCFGPTGQLASGQPDQLCYINALKASGDPFLVGFANGITPGLTPVNNPQLAQILNRDNGVFNTPDRLHNAVVRFDYQASSRDSVNLRLGYVHNNFNSSLGGIVNGTPDSYTLFVRDFSLLGTWSRNISNNVVNQTLVQVVPRNRSEAIPLHDNGINFSLGSLGLDAPGPGGTGTYGAPALLPYKAHQQRYQLEDNVSWSKGNHNFKFGASYRPANYTVENDLWFNPEFDFLDGVIPLINLASGIPIVQGHLIGFNAAFHLGAPGCTNNPSNNPCLGPASTNLSAPQSWAFGIPADVLAGFNNPTWKGWGHYFGSYVQDSWRLNQRLTMNAGVRFDVDGEPSPLGASFYASPRLGLAWDPKGDQKTVIRAGAGVYYAPIDVLIPSYGSLLDGSGRYINEVLVALSRTDPRVAELWQIGVAKGELPFGHLTAADYALAGIDITTPGASVGYSVAPNYTNPYSIQASLSIDRELVKNLSLELGYNMYHGVHLQMPVETAFEEIPVGSPLCPTPACTDASGGPLYAPKTGQFQHTTYSSNGSSIYHGFTASLTKRYSSNLQFQMNYTWSKTIDDTIDFSSFQNWFRPSRLDLFRAVSVFDIPHVFVANAVYTTPFKPQQGNFLKRALADISLSPILNMHSGLPFSTRTPGLQNGIPLDVNYAMPFHASRDANRGAAFYSWDMNFQKALFFSRDRGVRLNAIVQATNLLNHVNFIKVNDEFPITNQNFLLNGPFKGLHGVVPTNKLELSEPLFFSKADQPRQIQFGLKLAF